ncbi:hypothetical protein FA15DRAFT_573734, partial [Coprinopsis marcescibilis]
VFYDTWLKARYQRIELWKADKRDVEHWSYLRLNPDIAQRVDHVSIRPWLLQPWTQTYQSRTENVLNQLATVFDPDYMKKQAEDRFQKRLTKQIERVQSTLFSFTNAQGYAIEWDGEADYHHEFYVGFLLPVLRSWRSNLTSLTLNVPLHILGTLAQVSLPKMRDIDVCFNTGKLDFTSINIHLDAFLVFIHNLRDSLESLSFHSTPGSEELDMGRLFRHIGTFPHLLAIALTIPFDGGHLTSVGTFLAFLQRHSEQLRSITLKTTRCSAHSGPIKPDCQNWVQTVMGSDAIHFPRLESVSLALRPLKAPWDNLQRFLGRHARTIRSLSVTDRTLNQDDVRQYIISPLTIASSSNSEALVRLERLEIRVDVLSPGLLRLLAVNIPQLRTLKLTLVDKYRTAEYARNPPLFHGALRNRNFDCSGWALRRLIMSPGPDASWISALEAVLVECIPTLESVEEV